VFHLQKFDAVIRNFLRFFIFADCKGLVCVHCVVYGIKNSVHVLFYCCAFSSFRVNHAFTSSRNGLSRWFLD